MLENVDLAYDDNIKGPKSSNELISIVKTTFEKKTKLRWFININQ